MLDDHRFTVDCVQPKCTELRRLVQKLEVMLGEKRRILHKFLDLIDGIEAANKWSTSALSHLSRQEDPRSSLTDEDVSTFQRLENLRSNFSWPFLFLDVDAKIVSVSCLPIKLVQVHSTSKMLEKQRNNLVFFKIIPSHFCRASEA